MTETPSAAVPEFHRPWRAGFVKLFGVLLWLLGSAMLLGNFGVAYLRVDMIAEAPDTIQLYYSTDARAKVTHYFKAVETK